LRNALYKSTIIIIIIVITPSSLCTQNILFPSGKNTQKNTMTKFRIEFRITNKTGKMEISAALPLEAALVASRARH